MAHWMARPAARRTPSCSAASSGTSAPTAAASRGPASVESRPCSLCATIDEMYLPNEVKTYQLKVLSCIVVKYQSGHPSKHNTQA